MRQLGKSDHVIVASVFVILVAGPANAAVAEFTNRAAWEAAVGEFTTIGFAELPIGTWVTDQYATLGVHFTDGADQVIGIDFVTYPEDGMGLSGFSTIVVEFDSSQQWIAVDFPGILVIDLFHQEALVYRGTGFGGGGSGFFGGLVSDRPFDKAIIYDPFDDFVFIDDLHFGPPIPAPGALGVLVAGLLMRRRRQRSH